ncbi:MAG: GDSL-type esterase/lipase family protein [Eubacterium sp.]|nr:GDSL-type esterase/lipase family protein [Eubacterium sp.]
MSRNSNIAGCTAGILAAATAGNIAYRYLKRHPFMPKWDKGKKHLVCVGDSITFGDGVKPFMAFQSFPAYLQKLAPSGVQVLNFGLNGRTLLVEGDFPYTKESFYAGTFQIPDADWLVMLGTNDTKPYNWDAKKYKKELRTFLKRYIDFGGRGHVIVMKPPRAFVTPGNEAVLYDIRNEKIREAGKIIDEVAGDLKIPVIDLYSFTREHPDWFTDGVHPNKKGNKKIAEYIAWELY